MTVIKLTAYDGVLPLSFSLLCFVEEMYLYRGKQLDSRLFNAHTSGVLSMPSLQYLYLVCPYEWPALFNFSGLTTDPKADSVMQFTIANDLSYFWSDMLDFPPCGVIPAEHLNVTDNFCDMNGHELYAVGCENLELPLCANNSRIVEVMRVYYIHNVGFRRIPDVLKRMSNVHAFENVGNPIVDVFDFGWYPILDNFILCAYVNPCDRPAVATYTFTGTVPATLRVPVFIRCNIADQQNFWRLLNNSGISTLSLSGSNVSAIPENLLVNIKEIDVSCCPLRTLPTWVWTLAGMEVVQANGCELANMSMTDLNARSAPLSFAKLSRNNWTQVPDWLLQNVLDIDLSWNAIESVHFPEQARLRKVDFRSNAITAVVMPQGPVDLYFINLDFNPQLKQLPNAQSAVVSAIGSVSATLPVSLGGDVPFFDLQPPVQQHGNFTCLTLFTTGAILLPGNPVTPSISMPWTVEPAVFGFENCSCLQGYIGTPPICLSCIGVEHATCSGQNIRASVGYFIAKSTRGGFGAQECRCFAHGNVTFGCTKSACLSNGQNFSQIWSAPGNSTQACAPGYAGRLCSQCVCNSDECYFATHSDECELCDASGSFSQANNLRNGLAVAVIMIAFIIADQWWAKWLFGVLFVAATALASIEFVNGAVPLGVTVAWLLVKFLGRTRKPESASNASDAADDNDAAVPAINAAPVAVEPLVSFGGALEQLIFVFQVLLVLFDGLWPHSEWLTLYERAYAAARAMFGVHPSGLPCTFGPSLTRVHVFLLVMAVPIGTSAVVALMCVVRRFTAGLRRAMLSRCRGRPVDKAGEPLPWQQSLVGAILFMFGFMYFELVGTITSTYACQKDTVIERWFMTALPWHLCDMADASYSTLVYVSLPFLFAYVVGYPLALGILLRRKRTTLEDDATRALLGPSFEDYASPWQMSGALVNIARRLCLSIALAILPAGHPLRASLYSSVLACSMALLSRTSLRRIVGDDRLDLVSCGALLFVGSILLEPSTTDKSYFMLAYAQTYVVAVAVSVMLALLLVGALAFSVLSPAVQRRMWAACCFRGARARLDRE